MAFEKKVPVWKAQGVEPPESLKESGFEAGYKPPAPYFNWQWFRVSEALIELQEKALNENIIETTTETDLDSFNTVDYLGPWYCGGANNVKNKPAGVDSFSLVVMRTASGYFTQVLTAGNKETNKTFVRTNGAGSWSAWEEFAFTNGNVASATKLETARKINGIPFDGTEDISVGCIGYEPIATTEDDTVANWKALGSGYAVYTKTRLNEQPTDYGFVVQYVYNSLLYQEFHSMPAGGTWYRKGNNTGWWNDASNKGTWRKIYDEFHMPDRLATARNINGVPFDGSANIEINPIATLIDATRDMNLNAYSTIGHLGFWYAAGGNAIENKPDGVDAFGMLVMRSASGYITQILTAGSANTNIMYNRTYNGSAWTAWASLFSDCNKPTPADIGAATSDHRHALDYAEIQGILPIAKGGTGASTRGGALSTLGIRRGKTPSFSVASNSVAYETVSFDKSFEEAPIVVATLVGKHSDYMFGRIQYEIKSTSNAQFVIQVFNASSVTQEVQFNYIAVAL